MAYITVVKGNQSNIPISDGQMILDDVNHAVYVDTGTTRTNCGGDPTTRVLKTNVKSTLSACIASTSNDDVAGAKALKELNNKFTYGTTDLIAGTSTLATGSYYVVYE